MEKKIFCKFLKKIAEQQDYQVIPGKLGLKIYQEISKEAWKKWLSQQTILINENKLNMYNIDDRNKLKIYMKHFLFKS